MSEYRVMQLKGTPIFKIQVLRAQTVFHCGGWYDWYRIPDAGYGTTEFATLKDACDTRDRLVQADLEDSLRKQARWVRRA